MKLGNYKNLTVKKADTSVSPDELNSAFDALQKEKFHLIHTDSRPARDGTGNPGLHGYADGQSIPNSARNRFRLTLGSHSFIPGLKNRSSGKCPARNLIYP